MQALILVEVIQNGLYDRSHRSVAHTLIRDQDGFDADAVYGVIYALIGAFWYRAFGKIRPSMFTMSIGSEFAASVMLAVGWPTI